MNVPLHLLHAVTEWWVKSVKATQFCSFYPQAPASPQSAYSLLGDYITLAKTRLKDLNEALGFGLFGHGFVSFQKVKVKLSLCVNTIPYRHMWSRRGKAACVFNLNLSYRWMTSFTFQLLFPWWRIHWYALLIILPLSMYFNKKKLLE